jgi:photosystem II stability/assembly factor-like uncharacterized protein
MEERSMKGYLTKVTILCAVLCVLIPSVLNGTVDMNLFSGMKARAIGPANMSGRIGDIDVVLSNPHVIVVGTATGGVWKSVNGGFSWKPIFDDQPTSSIGAVAICQQNPNIIWVGTGEANPRNSVGVGRGMFKTIDGGKTWKKLGLEKTEKISRIILHPHNPDTAYAAALGTTWGENPERGVYKTTDGGKTWNKALFVDNKTGVADLIMAPDNPNKLIAAMWEHRRRPWFFNSGGPGSGIFITGDGGENWKRLTDKDGLPPGHLGRIGLAFAVNKPNIAYALVEAKKNVLLRSEDGGFTWKTVNNKPGVSGRPFYYADIRVNPQNENIVYSLQSRLKVSEDGGKNFKNLTARHQAHSDFQAMWIHPEGEYMIVGNDGGIVISYDRGKSWTFVRNLPLGQFYHVSFDMQIPYNVYGGLQDNGSWMGPAYTLTDRAIYDYHWKRVGGGDGFDTEPDPDDPNGLYAMSQGGHLFYFNHKTGNRRMIRPTETDVKHRYNWNAGLAIDPFEPTVIYYGSQFVHKSKDKGRSWEIISPDLTTNDPEKQKQAESGGLTRDVTNAENHTTILCIAPSPVEKGVIWVGTDDGNVQLTRDGGKNWQLVSLALTGTKTGRKKTKVPFGTCVPHVEASKFDAAEAFVVFENHQRADWTPYVFVTGDFGKTWKSLATPQIDGFVHVIEQDPVKRDLLFLGTEFALYVSFNGGKDWQKWTHGLPTAPVRDLSVHPREHDLIIGTHGRSIYILDDISPLREIDEKVLKKNYLFKPKAAVQFRTSSVSSYSTPADTSFMGQNRGPGAVVTYFYHPEPPDPAAVKDRKKEDAAESRERKGKEKKKSNQLKIEILDAEGKVINELKGTTKKGLNRVTWDLRIKGVKLPPSLARRSPFMRGPYVLPGTYTVKMTRGDKTAQQPLQVTLDPRYKVDMDILKKNYSLSVEIAGWMKTLFGAFEKIGKTITGIRAALASAAAMEMDAEKKKALTEKAKILEKKLKTLAEKLVPDRNRQGIYDRTALMGSKIFSLIGLVSDSLEPPTQAAKVKFGKVKELIDGFLKEYNELFQTDVEAFRTLVKEANVGFFTPFKKLKLETGK